MTRRPHPDLIGDLTGVRAPKPTRGWGPRDAAHGPGMVGERLVRTGKRVPLWLVVIAAVACGPEIPDGTPSDGETLTILSPSTPGDRIFTPGWPAKFLIFLPLAERNAEGELEPRLARSWEHSDDYRNWTIHLRTDVRWHDGVPVTAHDVAFTLGLMRHPTVGAHPPDAYQVVVLDDSTYTLEYQREAPGNPFDEWTAYLPKHLLEGLDPERFWEWEFWARPVGNGPYRFGRHVPSTAFVLEANPDYYLAPPRIGRVVLRLGQVYGTGSSTAELLAGKVDAVPYVDQKALLKFADDPRFRIYYNVIPNQATAVLWNHRRSGLGDPRVRRALTLAIDRRELRHVLGMPPEIPVFDGLPTLGLFRRGELPPGLEYDPAEAVRLLEEAGWSDRDGDGVRDQGGRPLAIELIASTWGQGHNAAVYVQGRLRDVGVGVELVILEHSLARERLYSGDFDALILGMSGPYTHRDLFGESSLLGYQSSEADALLRRAEETWDPQARDRIYLRLAEIFQADLPATILYPDVWRTVAHRRVRGLSSPWMADPTRHADKLWLAEDDE